MGNKKKREREEPCPVCGHYHDYEGGVPCGVCGHTMLPAEKGRLQAPSAMPSEVLPGFLFLGSYDHASRAELLSALQVDHILNTVPSCQNLYKNTFTYHTATASPPPLDECFAFLEDVRTRGGRVLVHCMVGASRSPAVVVYYLMRLEGWGLEQAHEYVKAKRPAVALQPADVARLQEAEAALRAAGAQAVAPGYAPPLAGRPAAPHPAAAAPAFAWGCTPVAGAGAGWEPPATSGFAAGGAYASGVLSAAAPAAGQQQQHGQEGHMAD